MANFYAHFYQPAAWLSVRGPDAAGFLQSQFSNDLAGMAMGGCVYGLWLDHKGKVQADSWVLREGEEAFRIFSYACPGTGIRERMEAHIIADDVEVRDEGPVEALSLYGSGAADSAIRIGGVDLPGAGAFAGSGAMRIFCGRRSPGPSYEVVSGEPAGAEQWREGVEAAVREEGGAFVSVDQLQVERLGAGIPLVPDDIGPGDLPGEGGLEEAAISFTKGCFLGQEVVARMHHVGRARRMLYRVSGAGQVPETPIELAVVSGEAAGELRSAAPAGDGGRWLGMALLKCRLAQGGGLHLPDGRAVDMEGGS